MYDVNQILLICGTFALVVAPLDMALGQQRAIHGADSNDSLTEPQRSQLARAAATEQAHEDCLSHGADDYVTNQTIYGSSLVPETASYTGCAKMAPIPGSDGNVRLVPHWDGSWIEEKTGEFAFARFNDGVPDGPAQLPGPDGAKSRGVYLHGKRSGEWTIRRPSTATTPQRETDVARQSYVNGNLSGKYVKYGTCWSDKERKIVRHIWEEGSYRNGQRDGHWAFWAAIEDGTSRDGVNGILKGTPEPCRKLEEQDYKMGKKDGNRTKWGYGLSRDGMFMFFPLERERYRDDVLNGPFLFWEPGAPFLVSRSGIYLNGQQCGSTTFYRNGFERRNGVDVWRNIDHFTESHGSCGSGVASAAR